MWALIDQNNIVMACVAPDIPDDELEKVKELGTLIKMTAENSPAYIGGKYDGTKFYKPKE